MAKDVPLVIPEVNPDHIKLIECQSWRRKSGGFVVTNSNCSAMGLVLALAPLHKRFELETVMAVTMQAVSGAGYPGVASLDILGNVIPYIAKEEEKMEEETRKLLGTLERLGRCPAPFKMSAQCNRVAVEDGHTESVSVKFKKKARRLRFWKRGRNSAAFRRSSTSLPLPKFRFATSTRPIVRSHVSMLNSVTA